MSNITFVFFTYNEERRIPFVIENFKKYGEIIIMDGGSTDKTKEISEKLGAKFFVRPVSDKPYVETQENFDFIKSKLNTDWIFWGYVDNLAPKSLLDKLAEISAQSTVKMVLTPLYTYLWGNTEHFAHKGYTQMFFHKDYIDFSDNHIHGMGKFTGDKSDILRLPNKREFALVHFSVYNIKKFVTGHLRYAESEALEKQKNGKKFSVIIMFAAILRYLWLFGKNGYRNGALGTIVMLSYAFSRFMTYVKLYELERGLTLDKIEDNYSVLKNKMLEDFKQ